MAGMRVEPPTNTTSSRSPVLKPASLRARCRGSRQRSINGAVNCRNLARVSDCTMCFGPVASEEMNGRLISAEGVCDSSCLAFSAASVSRCSA